MSTFGRILVGQDSPYSNLPYESPPLNECDSLKVQAVNHDVVPIKIQCYVTTDGTHWNTFGTLQTIAVNASYEWTFTALPVYKFKLVGTTYLTAVTFVGGGLNDLTPSGTFSGTVARQFRVTVDGVNGGLNDMTKTGTFTGTAPRSFVVKITTAGATNKFDWSDDAGGTWEATAVVITGTPQLLEEGVSVTFGHTTGHYVNDQWSWTATESNTGTIVYSGGGGLDDMTKSGVFTGVVSRSMKVKVDATNYGLDNLTKNGDGSFNHTANLDYVVKIDGLGTPDTFKWSDDGGSTWDATTVPCALTPTALNHGVEVTFGATTGHYVDDQWAFTCTASVVDVAVFGGGASPDDCLSNDGLGNFTGSVDRAFRVKIDGYNLGLDDANSSGAGSYTGAVDNAFNVEIDSIGATDTFKWNFAGGGYTSLIPITGGAQALQDGVEVTFGAVTGHLVGEKWWIAVTASDLDALDFTGGGGSLDDCTDNAGAGVFTGAVDREFQVKIDGLNVVLNDVTKNGDGDFVGVIDTDYVVEIDGLGSPDTFKWSDDGGATWDATTVPITGLAQTLNGGVTVTFANLTGHIVGNNWAFTATASVIDVAVQTGGSGLDDLTSNDGAGIFTGAVGRAFRVKIDGENVTLDDVTKNGDGDFVGVVDTDYVVEIDSEGGGTLGVDTFQWSDDGGATWDTTDVDCDTSPIALNNGVTVTFASETGHLLGNNWAFTAHTSIILAAVGTCVGLDDMTSNFGLGTFTGAVDRTFKVQIDRVNGALDDMAKSGNGSFTGATGLTYVVEIDGKGTGTLGVDTFKWSDDGGSTWDATVQDCDSAPITLNNGVTVAWTATTGHFIPNRWTFTTTPRATGTTNFTGSGIDDCSKSGAFTGIINKHYIVKIDSELGGSGGVDTFKWSDDNGATWEATGVDIDGTAQTLNDGQKAQFSATTGHTLNDQWDWTATASTTGSIVYTQGLDSFKWSKNGGSTWDATLVDMLAVPQPLFDGVEVLFGQIYGHTLNDYWIVAAACSDTGTILFTGGGDTFKWSKNGGTGWDATAVVITAAAQTLTEGVEITFAAKLGHTLDDYWDFDAHCSTTGSLVFTGGFDTFKWSKNGGSTWDATAVTITTAAQTLTEGVEITFAAGLGHTLDTHWDADAFCSTVTSPVFTGTYDSFQWSKNGGSTWDDDDVAITGAAQTLTEGVEILFGAKTGHFTGASDYWDFDAHHSDTGTLVFTGGVDKFTWSKDGGSTWDAVGVVMTGGAQLLLEGVSVTFAAVNGHTLNKYWTFTCTPTVMSSVTYAGVTDTFKWSKNDGVSWDATGIFMTAAAQLLCEGISVTFGAVTGHTITSYWDFDVSSSLDVVSLATSLITYQ
jgi:hypothetical protein